MVKGFLRDRCGGGATFHRGSARLRSCEPKPGRVAADVSRWQRVRSSAATDLRPRLQGGPASVATAKRCVGAEGAHLFMVVARGFGPANRSPARVAADVSWWQRVWSSAATDSRPRLQGGRASVATVKTCVRAEGMVSAPERPGRVCAGTTSPLRVPGCGLATALKRDKTPFPSRPRFTGGDDRRNGRGTKPGRCNRERGPRPPRAQPDAPSRRAGCRTATALSGDSARSGSGARAHRTTAGAAVLPDDADRMVSAKALSGAQVAA